MKDNMKYPARNCIAIFVISISMLNCVNAKDDNKLTSSTEHLNLISVLQGNVHDRTLEIEKSTALIFDAEIDPRRFSKAEMVSGSQAIQRLSKGHVSSEEAMQSMASRQIDEPTIRKHYEIFIDKNVSILGTYWPNNLGLQSGVMLFKGPIRDSRIFVVFDPINKTLHFKSGALDIEPLFSLSIPFAKTIESLNDLYSSGRVRIVKSKSLITVTVLPPPGAKAFKSGDLTIHPISHVFSFTVDECLDLVEDMTESNGAIVNKKQYSDYRELENGLRFPETINLLTRPLTSLTSELKINSLKLKPHETLDTSGTLYGLYMENQNLDDGFADKIMEQGWTVINSAEDAELLPFPSLKRAIIKMDASYQDNSLSK